MRLASLVRPLLLAVLTLTAAACKQGVGERCQVNSDCEDGLVCNPGQGICVVTLSNADGGIPGVDATDTTPADASVDAAPAADAAIDAVPADAAVDGAIDAAI